jgi:hypothetical protein
MKKATRQPRPSKALSKAKLDEMIEEAIVDAYGESEQTLGFYTMLEDNLAVPFERRSRSWAESPRKSLPRESSRPSSSRVSRSTGRSSVEWPQPRPNHSFPQGAEAASRRMSPNLSRSGLASGNRSSCEARWPSSFLPVTRPLMVELWDHIFF